MFAGWNCIISCERKIFNFLSHWGIIFTIFYELRNGLSRCCAIEISKFCAFPCWESQLCHWIFKTRKFMGYIKALINLFPHLLQVLLRWRQRRRLHWKEAFVLGFCFRTKCGNKVLVGTLLWCLPWFPLIRSLCKSSLNRKINSSEKERTLILAFYHHLKILKLKAPFKSMNAVGLNKRNWTILDQSILGPRCIL